ncbi:MAG: mucoidy inhibitor MuiA family protein [Phycisphaerales bacterium]
MHIARTLATATLVSLSLAWPLAAKAGADEPSAPASVAGTIDAITVYRGQAMVSRVIDIPGEAGLREIVVPGLPEFLIPASLYAESGDGVEVRSVSYRIRPLSEDAREGVRKIDAQIRATQDARDAVVARQAFLQWQRQYLEKLENFLAGTVQVENNRGVLNAETVAKMSELITTQRLKQTEEGQKLAIELREIDAKLALLQRELENVTVRTSRTAREAIILVNQARAGSKVRLNYLVDRATWSPSYNLRAPQAAPAAAGAAARPLADSTVAIEYQASIQQMSGEDWNNVAITLSTATPALVATGPRLQPLAIALAAPTPETAKQAAEVNRRTYADSKKELAFKQRDAESIRNALGGTAPQQSMDINGGSNAPAIDGQIVSAAAFASAGPAADKSLNDLAAQSQLLDVLTRENFDRREPRKPAPPESGSDEGVSVTYTIPSRATLPSRADQQLIQIAKIVAPAVFGKVATPVLTSYVYNEALITNGSDRVLLAGPSASYLGGEFVGRGAVPTVAAGETFTAGFGIDSSLRATRELVERTESIQGGNRVVDFTYKLALENFGKSPAAVRLIDRVPNPKGKDIKLTLVSTGKPEQPLSTDPTYEQTQRKNGVLRWDVLVPPGATGTNAYTLEYKFRLEYDKQMAITESAGG